MVVGRKDTGLLTTFDQYGVSDSRGGWSLPLGEEILTMLGPYEVDGRAVLEVRGTCWTLKLTASGEVVAFTGLEKHLNDDLLRITEEYTTRKWHEELMFGHDGDED